MSSLRQVVQTLGDGHRKFIEANYHLHHPRLLKERQALMDGNEVSSEPWVEATPSYVTEKRWGQAGLPEKVVELLEELRDAGLEVHDPPYVHQSKALQAFFKERKDLIVSTGTGSGKTEIFLYSILGQLALEAERKTTCSERGIRAIVLYPMNALVSDQLSRMRLLFGGAAGAKALHDRFGRPVQFGMLTSRTPYHGHYDKDRNDRQVRPIIDYYCNLEADEPALFKELKEKGRVPAKDLKAFRNFRGRREDAYRTHPGDVELFTRQEMYEPNLLGGAPDLLITNYSMLEYMLLRPIEQALFRSTKKWLGADRANQLVIVLDEAHLYRGAQGAEVALLLGRLLQRLEARGAQVRFILTSASLGPDSKVNTIAPRFAADLTSRPASQFAVITGAREILAGGRPGDEKVATALTSFEYGNSDEAVASVADRLGWPPFDASKGTRAAYLAEKLPTLPVFRQLHDVTNGGPLRLSDLATKLFPTCDPATSFEAAGNLLHLGSLAMGPRNKTLLPARVHVFFKGLSPIFACVDPKCPKRRIDSGDAILGRFYTEPRRHCECGARVFELLSHRTCGASYLRAFRHNKERETSPAFLWTEGKDLKILDEIHILLESPRTDPDPPRPRPLIDQTPHRFLHKKTGHLVRDVPQGSDGEYVKVWVPGHEQRPADPSEPWSWTRCPACGIEERRRWQGQTNIMDLETKGEEPFANIVRTAFGLQPPNPKKMDTPNKGRKLLCFSDGRQKAAKLARDLQRTVERDSLREVIVDVARNLDDAPMDRLFPSIAVYCKQNKIGFFDDSDKVRFSDGNGYDGSRTEFERIIEELEKRLAQHRLRDLKQLGSNPHAVRELNAIRPRQFNSNLLRLLGHQYYSLTATLVAIVRPTKRTMDAIVDANPDLNSEWVSAIVLELIRNALEEEAYDPAITDWDRKKARPFPRARKGGEGLDSGEIIPDYLQQKFGTSITHHAWGDLLHSLLYPADSDDGLFTPLQSGRFVLNPRFLALELKVNDPWLRCEGCRQFSAWRIADRCPREGCRGILSPVSPDDLHLLARNAFLRDPCREILQRKRQPFTLRSEEHSAQLSSRDRSEVFSKTEKYELLFQDVPITASAQPIDVLSCTTTMEVGIDIGSLTAVSMRTVPPRPENYQQRAGRAGRRGAGLSTILTFADNSPHETHHFRNPQLMIGAEASEPVVYVGNLKIAERHVNACLIEGFFDPSDMDPTADVFSSLGPAGTFFSGSGKYSLPRFKTWVEDAIRGGAIVRSIGELLPEKLKESIPDAGAEWRTGFVRGCGEKLVERLQVLQGSQDWSGDEEDGNLLSTLLDAALLPTFSFPIDSCSFVVREVEYQSKTSKVLKTSYEMTRGLKEALSDYIPGRQVVVDKKTFTSYGLHIGFPVDPVNRAASIPWDHLEWLNFCPGCETVVAENAVDLKAEGRKCGVCGRWTLESRHLMRPEGFAPRVKPGGQAEEGEEREDDRVYASLAKFPIPTDGEDSPPSETRPLGRAKLQRMPNRQLKVINFGPDNGGFNVCRNCGAVAREGTLANPHDRPYPRDFRVAGVQWPPQCSGTVVNTTFGYQFPTDLAALHITLSRPFNYAPEDQWFKTATRSALEALVRGASLVLGIDPTELAGGFRTLPRAVDDDQEISGYLELFLYDTTPGGAGFASRAYEEFGRIMERAIAILEDCSCTHSCHSCLRSYQNKLWHLELDRFLGAALLHYAQKGTIQPIPTSKEARLRALLESSLALMNARIQTGDGGARGYRRVSVGQRVVEFSMRSCLAEAPQNLPPDVVSISDHGVDNRLPEIAHEILERLG